jgi:hypothetical protein
MLLLVLGLAQLLPLRLGLLVTALQMCCRELKEWRVCAQYDRQQGRDKVCSGWLMTWHVDKQ